MDELSSAELIELVAIFDSAIDVQYQLWITITFALVVVSYVARSELSRSIQWIVAGLYVLVVIAIAGRWTGDLIRLLEITEVLTSRGIDFRPPLFIAPIFRAFSFIAGSVIAVLLLFFFDRLGKHQTISSKSDD